MRTVAVSGGFDPIHIGHIRMFENAKALGERLVVILNNDNWLKKKKGFVFMPESDRAEILKALRCVDDVYITRHPPNPEDIGVGDALREIKPDIFANGGDRKPDGVPIPKSESGLDKIGIEIIYNVGGGKIRSSSELTQSRQQ